MPSSSRVVPTSPRVVIAALALCGLVVSLMQTLVVPLLPRFPELLGASTSTVAWLVTATLVAGAVCAPVLGRLGDMYGRRRMLLVALGLIVVGSTVGALAPGIEVLIVGRVLQGASLGVVPLGISIMRDVLPPDRIGSGVALMSSSLGIGGAIGLPLTGAVAQQADWRWLFAGAAVIGFLLTVTVWRLVAESPSRPGGRFDLPGAVTLSGALVCLLIAVSKGSDWGWTSPAVLGSAAGAVALFAVWGRIEMRSAAPLVDLRVSARPAVLWTNLGSALIGFSLFVAFMVTTQVLQAPRSTGYGFGMSLLTAGVTLLPIGLAMATFSPVSAVLSRRFGARTTLVTGTAVLTVGNLAMAALPSTVPLMIGAAVVTSVGGALAYSAIPLLIMAAVPPGETAAANSLNTLMRMLGTSSCSAVVAAVASAFTVRVGGHVLPSATAFQVVFLAAAGAGGVATVISALTPHPVVAPEQAMQPA